MVVSSDRDERFAAYTRSVVWVDHPRLGPVVMTPRELDVRVGDFPAGAGEIIYVITAHNPGRQLTAEENDARHQELVAHVDSIAHVQVWRSVGGDPTFEHAEEGVSLVGLDDDTALAIGRRFGQEAIWAWEATELRLLDCHGLSEVSLGWQVTAWDGAPPRP